jgi:hypothetical protein
MNNVQTAINYLESGWMASADTWVYVSAATFKITGQDRTLIYTKGTKLLCTNSSTKYFYVVSSAYAGGDTTVTIAISTDAGSILANAVITSPYYSYAQNPQGFPAAMSYTPTGISAANATLTGRFRLDGNRCTVDFLMVCSGAITYTTSPTLPITASASYKQTTTANFAVSGVGAYWDNGTAYLIGGFNPCVVASATTFDCRKADGTIMSASVPITWANLDQAVCHFEYEI